jgi:hypothetical protein
MSATPSADMTQYMSAYEMKSKMRLPFAQLLEIARATKRTPRSIPLDEEGRITWLAATIRTKKACCPAGIPAPWARNPSRPPIIVFAFRKGACV